MNAPETNLPFEVDMALIQRLDRNGPRYTSYPTADRFTESFGAERYKSWLIRQHIGGSGGGGFDAAAQRPVSIYVHLPFCSTVCFYCACNKIVTANKARGVEYLHHLKKEIELHCESFHFPPRVEQMHWGGGTPTFLDDSQIEALVGTLRQAFDLDPWGEYAIEIDPRRVSPERIAMLGALGFNRVSFGVQDFEPEVQRAVHRIQSYDQTQRLVTAARDHGFRSVNDDLIYGLPKQTLEGFQRTLHRVLACDPDRIALYAYAHLPTVFKPQRRILEADLPSPEVKLSILTTAIRFLEKAGYVYIGMDHFALPNDELSLARENGTLQRNFQGYSTHADCDMIGLGITSIGKVGDTYSQNVKETAQYQHRLDEGRLPVFRGYRLSDDDRLRRDVINTLMCHGRLEFAAIEARHNIDFRSYFARALASLEEMADDGLIALRDHEIEVLPSGRLMIRNLAMAFDAYLKPTENRYSRTV